jgi:hypothetical protein
VFADQFSRTLRETNWQPASIASGDTPDAHPGRLRLAGSSSWASGILELDYGPWAP